MTQRPTSSRHLKASLGFALLVLICAGVARGQQVSSIPDAQWLNRYPKKQYYQGLELYRDGNLRTATEAFESALTVCLRDENGLWIDAIPVHAMLAECLYQAGDLRGALFQIEASLTLLSRHRGWIEAIDWSTTSADAFRPPDSRSAWAKTNPAKVLALPDQLAISARSARGTRTAASGAFYSAVGRARVDAIEILRGAAVAAYRRRLILGPLADQSPRLLEQVRGTDPGSKPQSPLLRTLLGAVDQCIRFASGQPQAVEDLQSLASIEEAIHPLTPVLLLAAARQALQQDRFAEAATLARRAAETASLLGQAEYVAESLLLVIGCSEPHATAAMRDAAAAAAVSHLRRGRLASLGALLAASEAALLDDDATAAETMLLQARGLLQRRELTQPRLAAHADYLAARLAARLGQSIGGAQATAVDQAVQRLLVFAQGPRGGPPSPATARAFQLNLARARAGHRGADAAQSEQLLGLVTVDPPTWLWKADPVDALAYHGMDRSPAIATQLELAAKRDASLDLVTLSDALLRHRFLAQLPLGGRVQQVRQIASADPDLLVGPAATMRANAPENLQRLIDLLTRLQGDSSPAAIHSGLLESMATEIALDRAALPAAMPLPVTGKSNIGRLPVDHAILIYVDLGGQFLGLLLHAERVQSWTLPPSRTLAAEVGRVLRGIGVPTVIAGSRIDDSQPWMQEAAKLRRRLLPDQSLAVLQDLKHLVVVPDGVLWYLPMELLPLSDATLADGNRVEGSSVEADAERLGERFSIGYSPSPGLALSPAGRFAESTESISLVCESLFAPHDAMLNASRIDQVANASVDPRRLPAKADAAAIRRGKSLDILAVLADIKPASAEPLEFSPIPTGVPDPLREWLRLPLQAPRSVILPGFRAAAADTPIGDGNELFMTLTALHGCGVRDVLISRWVVGGESTTRLMSELLQEMPFEGLGPAWRRSVQLLRRNTLDPQSEPLLTGKDAQRDQVSGDHPLFWSGYLLNMAIDKPTVGNNCP